ncbi:MAG: hypothetical protein DELT_01709 [Desulfovibrio sp.]
MDKKNPSHPIAITYDSMVSSLSSRHRTTLDKLFVRPTLGTVPYSQVEALLLACGAQKSNRGKTSGSRTSFLLAVGDKDYSLVLHRPHPGNEMKKHAIEQVAQFFQTISLEQPGGRD